jgi:hypothetical protein
MKISTEIDEILRKPDRTNEGMAAKTLYPSKSQLLTTNYLAGQNRGSEPNYIGKLIRWVNI